MKLQAKQKHPYFDASTIYCLQNWVNGNMGWVFSGKIKYIRILPGARCFVFHKRHVYLCKGVYEKQWYIKHTYRGYPAKRALPAMLTHYMADRALLAGYPRYVYKGVEWHPWVWRYRVRIWYIDIHGIQIREFNVIVWIVVLTDVRHIQHNNV